MGQLNFMMNYPIHASQSISMGGGNLSFAGFNFIGSISLNTVNMLVARGGTDFTVSASLGLYSLTGSTLTLINSLSGTINRTNNQPAWFSLTATSATQNISPGTWYWAILATHSSQSGRLVGQTSVSPANSFPGGFIGGIMTVTTNALPANYAISDLNTTGNNAMFVPCIYISA